MNYYIKHKTHGGYKHPELNLPEMGTVINLNDVESIYVGKGNSCRCGCGGDYFRPSEDPKATKKIKHYLKKMGSGKYEVESIENYIFEIVISERYDDYGRLKNQRVATIYLHDSKRSNTEQKEEVK